VSAALLLLSLRGVDAGDVADVIADADPALLLATLVLMAAVYAVQSERWRWIARREARLDSRSFLRLVLGSVAVNNVVPGRPGEILRSYWLARLGGTPVSRAFATVLVDRMLDVVALAVLLTLSLPFTPHPTWLLDLYIAALVAVGACMVFLIAAWWYSKRSQVGRARGEQTTIRRSRLRRQVSGVVRTVADTVNARDLAGALLLSVVAWSLWSTAAWTVASTLGIHLSAAEVLFVSAVLNLGVAIPSSPGFVGTYQWLAVNALALFEVGRSEGFAFSVLMHAVWFIPTTLVGLGLGIATLAQWRRRASGQREGGDGAGRDAAAAVERSGNSA
jgi:uncharacterized protein (TIRG00374 family)